MAHTLPELVARRKASALTERSAYQQHFIDLCEVLAEKRPAEVDQTGETYAFEKGVTKSSGGEGFAEAAFLTGMAGPPILSMSRF